ncbi:RNA methyltransferase [Candidatus Villigracilis affinis]|uniref:RNA methyltransferase n=1 Tax=Candidatus Villigracilis affinis TaxID=3140682 RepID=UPI002A21CD60|nr:RNA methyltransferase [Anaerolineales bacterium]
MPISSFEIRVCQSCGLRYPLTVGHSFGVRCPHCLGETLVVLSKQIGGEGASKEEGKREMKAVLLDNIRSAWNVGSILRSADGFGFSHAYLCGITPTPEVDAVRKTALGADEFVTWSHHKDAVKLVTGLKLEGWKVVALEEDERSIPISRFFEFQFPHPIVLLVGSEVTGVDPELLELADAIFHIPMRGQKRSFNVAVAFGVAGFSLSS